MAVWKHQEWYDPHLYWDPKNFSGEDHMHVNEENLWVPDTYLFNTLDIEEESTERKMPAKLFPDIYMNSTRIVQLRPAILRTACLMNVKYFPWDVQTCTLEYGSWSFPVDELDYHIAAEGFSIDHEYIDSQEWAIHKLAVERIIHEHHGKQFATLEFTIVLWRMPLYYIFNLIVPTVIITIISFLGLFSLTSSSGERGEKVSLGMGTILALAVVMLMVQDTMPNTSLTNPMISWYFLILIILEALALCMTVFIVHLQHRETAKKPLPRFLRRMCCIKKKKTKIVETKKTMDFVTPDGTKLLNKRFDPPKKTKDGDLNHAILLEISIFLYDIRRMMHEIYTDQSSEEDDNSESEYEFVASKLEQIGFWLFTITTFGITVVYLVLGYSSR